MENNLENLLSSEQGSESKTDNPRNGFSSSSIKRELLFNVKATFVKVVNNQAQFSVSNEDKLRLESLGIRVYPKNVVYAVKSNHVVKATELSVYKHTDISKKYGKDGSYFKLYPVVSQEDRIADAEKAQQKEVVNSKINSITELMNKFITLGVTPDEALRQARELLA